MHVMAYWIHTFRGQLHRCHTGPKEPPLCNIHLQQLCCNTISYQPADHLSSPSGILGERSGNGV